MSDNVTVQTNISEGPQWSKQNTQLVVRKATMVQFCLQHSPEDCKQRRGHCDISRQTVPDACGSDREGTVTHGGMALLNKWIGIILYYTFFGLSRTDFYDRQCHVKLVMWRSRLKNSRLLNANFDFQNLSNTNANRGIYFINVKKTSVL